jgi:hypothetical protein
MFIIFVSLPHLLVFFHSDASVTHSLTLSLKVLRGSVAPAVRHLYEISASCYAGLLSRAGPEAPDAAEGFSLVAAAACAHLSLLLAEAGALPALDNIRRPGD